MKEIEVMEELEAPELNDRMAGDLRKKLVNLNNNVGSALAELEYAQENDVDIEAVIEMLVYAEKNMQAILNFLNHFFSHDEKAFVRRNHGK